MRNGNLCPYARGFGNTMVAGGETCSGTGSVVVAGFGSVGPFGVGDYAGNRGCGIRHPGPGRASSNIAPATECLLNGFVFRPSAILALLSRA
jgi:hypothetical protein